MAYLLYIIILFAFCFVILRGSFFLKSGISEKWLIAFFLARAVMGLVNCYLSYHFFEISDSLTYHNTGLNEYYQLITNPKYFFKETFNSYGNHYSGLLATSDSFWNNLKNNVIVKTLGILDIFTFRNFYVNTLIFNISVFIGSVAFYRTIRDNLHFNSQIIAPIVFLYPFSLFFTSTIHKDGLVWMCLGLVMFSFSRLLSSGINFKRILLFLFGFLLIFAIRNYLSFVLVPALVAWWLSYKNPTNSILINVMILSLCVLLFFSLKIFLPAADFPQFVVSRLESFDELASISRTYLPVKSLTPDFLGFVQTFPVAFVHSFLMPSLWSKPTMLEMPFAIEIVVLQILFIIWLFRRKFKRSPIAGFILFVSLVSIIMIGFTVPNLGAIIRYRSIYLHLILLMIVLDILPNTKHDKNI